MKLIPSKSVTAYRHSVEKNLKINEHDLFTVFPPCGEPIQSLPRLYLTFFLGTLNSLVKWKTSLNSEDNFCLDSNLMVIKTIVVLLPDTNFSLSAFRLIIDL